VDGGTSGASPGLPVAAAPSVIPITLAPGHRYIGNVRTQKYSSENNVFYVSL